MASDANLIKGARDAYSGAVLEAQAGKGLDMMYNTAMGMMQEQQAETKLEIKEQKQRNRDLDAKWHENMEAANTSSQNLSEQHYKEVQNAIKGLRMDFDNCAFNDESCKREVMAKMNAQTNRMNQQKDLRAGNKEAYNNGLLSGSLTGPEKHIMGIYMNPNASDYTLSYDGDPMEGGQAIYTISNPDFDESQPESDTNKKTLEYKESDITKMFDKQIDVEGKKTSSEFGVTLHNDGLNGVAFDEFKTKAKYDDIINEKSLHSFTHDDMGYGSFAANFSQAGGPIDEALMEVAQDPNNTFNIPAKDGEANWYDTIDDEDRQMMFNVITNSDREQNPLYDEKLHSSVVKDYYYKMPEKQHKAGDKKRQDEITRKNNERLQKKIDDELDFNRKKQLKSMKAPTDKEINMNQRGDIISGIVNTDFANLSVDDFSAMDGMRFKGGKAGSQGGYVRAVDANGNYDPTGKSGIYGVFSGDPDLNIVKEGEDSDQEFDKAVAVSILSKDPSKMEQELFNLFDAKGGGGSYTDEYLDWIEGDMQGAAPPMYKS